MSPRVQPTRPRPVAETPVAALVADAPDLAKRWLIALIAAAPLPGAERLDVPELVHRAPALCEQVVRSLASDLECERLTRAGDLTSLAEQVGHMAGADEPAGAVTAVEALRSVLWSAMMAELRDPTAMLVAELADRLAHVCALVSAAAVSAPKRTPVVSPAPPRDAPSTNARARRLDEAARVVTGSTERSGARSPAIETVSAAPAATDPVHPPGQATAVGVSSEGPASWIGSIGRRLDRFQEDGLPFAVLLIELADLDRLRQAEPAEEFAELVSQVERAVSGVLRPADLLSRESIGRYWLVTPETDAEGARALAERAAFAVQADASHRGAPLRVVIGTAVCPDDGHDAASLAARADIAMYGARASGRPVVALDESL